MLLSDGRIARFQSRSLRRKDAPTVTSFLLGLLRSTSLAYANFDSALARHSERSRTFVLARKREAVRRCGISRGRALVAKRQCGGAKRSMLNDDTQRYGLLKMTHYINLVQTSPSGYKFANLACKNIDFGGVGEAFFQKSSPTKTKVFPTKNASSLHFQFQDGRFQTCCLSEDAEA